MTYYQFFDEVYPRYELPNASLQYKGTDICADMRCMCGKSCHVDGSFVYYYRCPCGKVYALDHTIKLLPLTPEQVQYLEDNDRTIINGEEPE